MCKLNVPDSEKEKKKNLEMIQCFQTSASKIIDALIRLLTGVLIAINFYGLSIGSRKREIFFTRINFVQNSNTKCIFITKL